MPTGVSVGLSIGLACVAPEETKNNNDNEGTSQTGDTVTTNTGDTDAVDTGVTGTSGYYDDPAGAPVGTYPDSVVEVAEYADLMAQLATLEAGHHALVDVSAYWCGPCQDWKPVYAYGAEYDRGQHLWILSEDREGDEEWPTSYDIWSNWVNGAVEFASCWESDYFYPQIFVVKALGDGAYNVHLMGYHPYLFRYADEDDTNTYLYNGTEEIVFNDDRGSNELLQVEDGAHAYDAASFTAEEAHGQHLVLTLEQLGEIVRDPRAAEAVRDEAP